MKKTNRQAKSSDGKEIEQQELIEAVRVNSVRKASSAGDCCEGTKVIPVKLTRCDYEDPVQAALDIQIAYFAKSVGFDAYKRFIDRVLAANETGTLGHTIKKEITTFQANLNHTNSTNNVSVFSGGTGMGTIAYDILKLATEVFLVTRGLQSEIKLDTDQKSAEPNVLTETLSGRKFDRNKLVGLLGSHFKSPYLDLIVDQLEFGPTGTKKGCLVNP
jgi:hypothetical protein